MPFSDADKAVVGDIMSASDRVAQVVSSEATLLAGYDRPLIVEHSSPTVQIGKKYHLVYTYVHSAMSDSFGAIANVDSSIV